MGAFLAKTVIVLLLAAAIFGGAAYYTYELFIRPQDDLKKEKLAPATPPPPDPALPEFKKAMATIESGDLLGAREALTRFIEQNPHSLKIDEAKDKLGAINSDIFLTPKPAPEKQVYVVRQGDVLNKVARITKTTPELLMKANGLTGTMLRIDQRLYYTPAAFSMVLSKKDKKITLLNNGKFFKQYSIRTMPTSTGRKGSTQAPRQQAAKVVDKIAWGPSGGRVIFSDKEYAEATFWISLSVPGATIYSEIDASSRTLQPNKPPTGGFGVAPEAAAELAALLPKGSSVTIEN
jgi:hypothetical protein